ncbi:hypothetical protein F383_12382 [Gossypium arboreum]|uniref:Uncharacterized protein n=1 Tax=Gossypium arboreum TaxID=29729 RepID=A0A0B0NBJ4_GOSAR|nr:hypothetical protein F383_12382 [Gossypium arboreum]
MEETHSMECSMVLGQNDRWTSFLYKTEFCFLMTVTSGMRPACPHAKMIHTT